MEEEAFSKLTRSFEILFCCSFGPNNLSGLSTQYKDLLFWPPSREELGDNSSPFQGTDNVLHLGHEAANSGDSIW